MCSFVLRFYWFEPCRHSRYDDSEHNGAHARTEITHIWQNGTCSTRHKTCQDSASNIAVALGWRYDDGKEHAIKGHAQCGHYIGGPTMLRL